MSTAAHTSEPLSSCQVPVPTPEQLPDDLATLKNMIVELVVTLRQRDRDLEQVRQRVHVLLQRLYGRRSERLNPAQPLLFPSDNDASASGNDNDASAAPAQGVKIPRSTSCGWMAACAELLRPLYDLMVASVLQSAWLHTDDTPVKNLDHEPGETDKSRFWIYYGDRTHPYNVFDFTINRKRDGPQTFLAKFHGYLHADAFTGYDALYLPSPRAGKEPIKEVACNAHARRKFHDAKLSDELRAYQALGYYRALYMLEGGATANNFDDDQRLRMRQDLSVPLLEEFKAWLDKQRDQVLPKSPMAEAIGYALNNWSALIRYTEAGFLSIDNNVAEREMKRIAIGRKNWLFVGSENGGRTAAVLFTFTATCHRLSIDPWAYLHDVLTRLPRTSADQLAELLPDRWQAARQAPTLNSEASSPSGPVS
jgi:transposase